MLESLTLEDDPVTAPSLRKRPWRFTRYQDHCLPGEVLDLPLGLPPIPGVQYLVCQLEICPTTLRKHLQGFLYFRTLKSIRSIIRHWPCSLQRCDNIAGAIAYCQKEDTRVPDTTWVEFGDKPQQGKRKDLPEFVELVKQGATKKQLLESHTGVIARYRGFYEAVKELYMPTRQQPKVCLLVGATGTGKSTVAREMCGNVDYYVVPKTKVGWFNGYDGQQFVIFDDFKGHLPLLKLLEILDPWPVRLEVKGSFCWLTADKIIFTSNYHPKDWYDYEGREESKCALYRRIHGVFEFDSYRHNVHHDTTWSPDCDTSKLPYFTY